MKGTFLFTPYGSRYTAEAVARNVTHVDANSSGCTIYFIGDVHGVLCEDPGLVIIARLQLALAEDDR